MPTKKVGAGLLAGALSVILVWAVKEFAQVAIPEGVGQSFSVLFTFAVQYFVPETE